MMLANSININVIKNQVDAAQNMQEAFKYNEAKNILINLAKDILKTLGDSNDK